MNVHILMLGSFTPIHVPTATARCRRSIGPRKWRSAGNIKKEFLNVDGGTFTPLVFSAMGDAGPAASTFLKRLADKDATKKLTFKVENNSLELTRIFKENIMTDCEREKEEVDHVHPSLRMVEMPLVVCPFAFKPPLFAWG